MDKAHLRPQNRTRALTAGIAIAALAVWMILADTPAQAEDPGDCEVAYSPEIGRCETPDSRPKPPPSDPDQPDPDQPDPDQPDPDSPDPDQPDLPPDSEQRRLGWATATVHDPTTTPQRIATALGLPEGRPVWEWDTENQVWRSHPPDADSSLPAGIAIAYKGGYTSAQAQTEAGIGPTDQTIRLYNGWNILTAPHDKFLLDNSLIDCATEYGAIAVLRYDTQTSELTATLTCHPQRRPMNLNPITQINPGDTIYIYYRTLLPVIVQYHAEQYKYAP